MSVNPILRQFTSAMGSMPQMPSVASEAPAAFGSTFPKKSAFYFCFCAAIAAAAVNPILSFPIVLGAPIKR